MNELIGDTVHPRVNEVCPAEDCDGIADEIVKLSPTTIFCSICLRVWNLMEEFVD